MVGNDTNIPRGKFPVHRPAGVGDHQAVNSQQFHQPDGIGDFPHGIALIGVKPALHTQYILPRQVTGHKLPGVAGGGAQGHPRHLAVGNRHRLGQAVGQIPQTAAQNQANLRLGIQLSGKFSR